MELKTYRAKTMQEALAQVRRELGPRAAVLHTRRVRDGWMGLLSGARLIEVVASASVHVPSRLASKRADGSGATVPARPAVAPAPAASAPTVPGPAASAQAALAPATPAAAVRALAPWPGEPIGSTASTYQPAPKEYTAGTPGLHDAMFAMFAELIEADMPEDLARELIEELRRIAEPEGDCDVPRLRQQLVAHLVRQLPVAGPIRLDSGSRRLVALVGPTGVGKTTTIAKLAANYRLREQRRVGLITVDTYRIAAVEQLRTYADIIDLPMEIVATPREMHQALARLSDLDLVLMDTAGRSPRDEVKIQELKSLLAQAEPDEVHLVLSSVAGASGLCQTAQQFAAVGTTALVLTKLDEATSLGNLLPLLRRCGLPLSYLTDGQNVPDDIAPADAERLARSILDVQYSSRGGRGLLPGGAGQR